MADTPESRFQAEASRFLLDLASCIQLTQLHEANNQSLIGPILSVTGALEKLTEKGGPLSFEGREQVIFVNGLRLRSDGATFLRHLQFLNMLERRMISGMTFQRPLTEPEWRDLLQAISRYDRLSRTPFEDISAAVEARGLKDVSLIKLPEGPPVTRLKNVRIERRVFAVRTMAKAIVILKKYVENMMKPGTHRFYPMKLQRVLQDMVTVCIDDGWKYIGVVNNKPGVEYLYEHGVCVALSTLVVAIRLGLKRSRLAEVGMSAVLHDLGKALLPGGLMDRTDKFTPEERAQIKKSPSYGVRALLREGQYNEGLLKRILVLCEHQRPAEVSSHPYSRLVAVAERFDALTSPRPYRAALLPDAAIQKLLTLQELDHEIVLAFVRTMGLYPPGTLLELSTGELAVAFHPHPDPKLYRQPIVRIARDEKGRDVAGAPVVDLAAEGIEVTRSVDPATAGIRVSNVLSRAATA